MPKRENIDRSMIEYGVTYNYRDAEGNPVLAEDDLGFAWFCIRSDAQEFLEKISVGEPGAFRIIEFDADN